MFTSGWLGMGWLGIVLALLMVGAGHVTIVRLMRRLDLDVPDEALRPPFTGPENA